MTDLKLEGLIFFNKGGGEVIYCDYLVNTHFFFFLTEPNITWGSNVPS